MGPKSPISGTSLMEASPSPHLLGPTVPDERSVKVGHHMNTRQAESQLGMMPLLCQPSNPREGAKRVRPHPPSPLQKGAPNSPKQGDDEGETQGTPKFFPFLVLREEGNFSKN